MFSFSLFLQNGARLCREDFPTQCVAPLSPGERHLKPTIIPFVQAFKTVTTCLREVGYLSTSIIQFDNFINYRCVLFTSVCLYCMMLVCSCTFVCVWVLCKCMCMCVCLLYVFVCLCVCVCVSISLFVYVCMYLYNLHIVGGGGNKTLYLKEKSVEL